jgi:DNA-binding response OmpR family regulator
MPRWIAAAHGRSPALPAVVLVAGHHRDDTLSLRRRAFALGAADVIGWPADPRALHARLAAVRPLPDHHRRDGDAVPHPASALPPAGREQGKRVALLPEPPSLAPSARRADAHV